VSDPSGKEKLGPGPGDRAHTAAKALISAVPYVGGPAAEIFEAVVVPPLAKRRDKWIESIAKDLQRLEEAVKGFSIEELAENESFVSTVMHATHAAIRNHQEEKLSALSSAVLNSALPHAPEEDLQAMFLGFVDTMTPWHLRVLKFWDDPQGWARRHQISFPNWSAGSRVIAMEHALPELRDRREFGVQLVRDLYMRGLLVADRLDGTVTGPGMLAPLTTAFGKQFIDFITSPLDELANVG